MGKKGQAAAPEAVEDRYRSTHASLMLIFCDRSLYDIGLMFVFAATLSKNSSLRDIETLEILEIREDPSEDEEEREAGRFQLAMALHFSPHTALGHIVFPNLDTQNSAVERPETLGKHGL